MSKIFKNIGSDLSSAVVVFLVALPLCLGIAMGSGAPLFAGIIAGIIGGIVIGSLSGSQLSVSGPAAGLTVIVASGITSLPTYEVFLLAVVLSGMFQIILGFIKAGIIGDYIPTAVITGMLSAIGIILILKQVPHFVGYDADYEGDESFSQANNENTFSGLLHAVRSVSPLAVIIGLLSLGIQILWEKVLVKKGQIFKMIPAPLVVVLMAILVAKLFEMSAHPWALDPSLLVKIPVASSPAEFASFVRLPDFAGIGNGVVWKVAITIALVASLETLLSIEAADALDPYGRVTPTNRELKAQGVGNMVSGLLGGIPLTSVIVRTSANVNAGAKSKMSSILHGLLLLLSVAFIPKILNIIPLAALAGVLIYTGFKLAKPSIFAKFYKKGFDQFAPFVITIIAILFTDLLVGILIGLVSGLFFVLRSNFRTSVVVVNDDNKYLFRLRKDVSFLNKPILKAKLEQVPENAYVLIDTLRADFIDKDVVQVINDFLHHAHLKNIRVEIKKSSQKASHALIEDVETKESMSVQNLVPVL